MVWYCSRLWIYKISNVSTEKIPKTRGMTNSRPNKDKKILIKMDFPLFEYYFNVNGIFFHKCSPPFIKYKIWINMNTAHRFLTANWYFKRYSCIKFECQILHVFLTPLSCSKFYTTCYFFSLKRFQYLQT